MTSILNFRRWFGSVSSRSFECRLVRLSTSIRFRDSRGGGVGSDPPRLWWVQKQPRRWRVNTRTGGGSENHTVWRGGHIMPPPSISAPMRANATNFGGYLGPYYNFFWPKFWDHGSTPSWSKRVEFPKSWPFWQKRTVFRLFRASSVTIIAMKNLKKAFESSWNALSWPCHQISGKVNSLGYTGHRSWKKNTIFEQNILSWITFFLIKIQQ